MSQDNLIKLACTECKRRTYYTYKNVRKIKNRLELSKFCKHCHKHTKQKETK